MSNESTDLANCSHSESSRLSIRKQQILTEEEKKERRRQQKLESKPRAREEKRKNKVVKHHQLRCHHLLHQRVPIFKPKENK